MATLTVSNVTSVGAVPTLSVAEAGGDEFANTGAETLIVYNGSASSMTVTVTSQKVVDTDLAVADRTLTVTAGDTGYISGLNAGVYNDGNGMAQISYSDETSVEVAAVKFNKV